MNPRLIRFAGKKPANVRTPAPGVMRACNALQCATRGQFLARHQFSIPLPVKFSAEPAFYPPITLYPEVRA